MSFAFRDYNRTSVQGVGTTVVMDLAALPNVPEAMAYGRINTIGSYAAPSAAGNVWLFHAGAWRQLTAGVDNGYGSWPVVLDDTYVYWQEKGYNGVRRQVLDGSSAPDLIALQPQSEGLLDVVAGVVRTCDRSQPYRHTRNDGSVVTLLLWMERNGTVIGQSNYSEGYQAYRPTQDILYRVTHAPLQVPPRLSAGGTIAAITGDVPVGFITDDEWTVEVPDYPVVPLTKPTLFGVFVRL